eukprot:TRINITY_DN45729_c0_g1_i1.p1 TRINITY_DN45729_c0_g1~~TRINITY_DN45729_c0_g1_i1.p1  ORF type:complete len:198 (-),score=28.87 TRINITY_DN45729_c0_g1_i1:223-816(-)
MVVCVCANCGRLPEAALRCGRCRQTVYCGKTCQSADWRSGHRYVCRGPAAETSEGGAQHVEEVREALTAVEEPEIRTDADNAGSQIRAAPLRRHDAPIEDLDVDPLPSPREPVRSYAEVRNATTSADEALRTVEDSANIESHSGADSVDPVDSANIESYSGADSVDAVEPFALDPEFDYDTCPLSKPVWPYNERPRR